MLCIHPGVHAGEVWSQFGPGMSSGSQKFDLAFSVIFRRFGDVFLSHTEALPGSYVAQIGSKLRQHALDDVCKACRRCPSPWGSKGDL